MSNNDKKSSVSRLLDMQKKIQNLNKQTEEKIKEDKSVIPIIEEPTEVAEDVKQDESALPSKYLSINQVKLSAKEVANTTNYLEKLKQTDDRYETIKMTEEKAVKIRRELVRLTTGVSAVVPLQCKGSQCSFSTTCLTGDTLISGYTDRYIKDIEVGDKVYSFNLDTNTIEKDFVVGTKTIKDKPIYKLTTKYGSTLKLTEDHKVLVYGEDDRLYWDSVDISLVEGDRIFINDVSDTIDEDLESYSDLFVDYIETLDLVESEDVYDITVKNNSNFFANSILVHNCPYMKEGIAPLNLPCPVEQQLLEYWMEKYKEEYGIQDNQLTDLHAVGRLCTYDIYEMRLTRYIAENDQTLLVDFISSYDEDSNPISNKATSAAWDTIDKIDRMRSKVLKELMATREAKAKLLTTVNDVNKSNSFSALKTKFEELVKLTEAKVVGN